MEEIKSVAKRLLHEFLGLALDIILIILFSQINIILL
jgi:hypothetical protein